MHNIYYQIDALVQYAADNLSLDPLDCALARNGIMDILGLDTFEEQGEVTCDAKTPEGLIADLINTAIAEGYLQEEDAGAAADRVMASLSLRPSEIERIFDRICAEEGTKAATDFLYSYCVKNNYVKKAQLDRNPRFDTAEGLVVTINLAKPEFRDSKKAASGNSVKGGFPKCVICAENEGFGPRGKRVLRKIDLDLNGDRFFWQYSPYGYFREHGIAVNYEHTPMHISADTFPRLLDFVDRFPHYFIGCNACLPRIGGSVLAHDHYQGGGEILPLQKASIAVEIKSDAYPDLTIGILDWPGTAVRIVGKDRDRLAKCCEDIRAAWFTYSDPAIGIIAKDEDGQHSSVSPTVIKVGDRYEFSIILRNNITSEQYPDGVFHAHPEFHVIKKESIGLIEAQGLFILPGRLEKQLADIRDLIVAGKPLTEELADFSFILGEILARCSAEKTKETVDAAIREELGSVCYRILENTAVFADKNMAADFVRSALKG